MGFGGEAVELLGLYLMLLLGTFLLLDGLRRIVVQGFSKSVWQVLGCVALIVLLFGLPLLLDGLGGAFHLLAVAMSMAGLCFIALFAVFSIVTLVAGSKPIDAPFDLIIVLGAGLREGVRPTRLLAGRLKIAKRLYEERGGICRIVVCGGQGSDEKVTEAFAMRKYLVDLGVPEGSIVMEGRSTTTMENLLYASELANGNGTLGIGNEAMLSALARLERRFGFERMGEVRRLNRELVPDRGPGASRSLPRAVVVTSNFHVARTMLHARMVPGLDIVGYVGKSTQWYYLPAALLRDFLSLVSHVARLLLGRES